MYKRVWNLLFERFFLSTTTRQANFLILKSKAFVLFNLKEKSFIWSYQSRLSSLIPRYFYLNYCGVNIFIWGFSIATPSKLLSVSIFDIKRDFVSIKPVLWIVANKFAKIHDGLIKAWTVFIIWINDLLLQYFMALRKLLISKTKKGGPTINPWGIP